MLGFLKRFLGIGGDAARRRRLYEEQLPPRAIRIDRARLLKYVPELHPSVTRAISRRHGPMLEWELAPEQRVAPAKSFFPKFFFRRRRVHRLVLDDFGRRVVEAIDGRAGIGEIAASVGKGTPYPPDKFEDAVIAFIGELVRRNAVTLAPGGKG